MSIPIELKTNDGNISIGFVDIINEKTKGIEIKKKCLKLYSNKYKNINRILLKNQKLNSIIKDNDILNNFTANDVITAKYLPRQISWKTVFILEYLGPLLIYLFCFMKNKIFEKKKFYSFYVGVFII